MNVNILHIAFLIIFGISGICNTWGCTSAIVSAKANPEGRTLLWKHRDTGHEHNFVARVKSTDHSLGYVALFNGGDSLLNEAWIGMNDAGFAIMNTASYNLAPDTAVYKDREGYIMSQALRQCRTLADFEKMLDTLPRPFGVQANFGAIDASGSGAYYETSDYEYTKYDVADDSTGVLIRTNFSYSAPEYGGMGFIRHGNAKGLLDPYVKAHKVTPEVLTEVLSRSYYHSVRCDDVLSDTVRLVRDSDFIPRYSTSASVVIEMDKSPSKSIMWTMMGYPPCSSVLPVTLYTVPSALSPIDHYRTCPVSEWMSGLKHNGLFNTVDGVRYVNLDIVRQLDAACRKNSMKAYRRGRKLRNDYR